VFQDQLITVLATHSDNCATHFKSSISLEWYTRLYRGKSTDVETRIDSNNQSYTMAQFRTYHEPRIGGRWVEKWDAGTPDSTAAGPTTGTYATWNQDEHCFAGMRSLFWDFGPPGHGKGVWDGLFGMFKQWMRTRANEALTHPDSITTDSGRLAKPWDCYEQLKAHFDSQKWRKAHAHRAISHITVQWLGQKEIKRPAVPEVHYRCTDILKTYQFLVLRHGHVARRSHSCWCAACYGVAVRGPLSGVLGSGLVVKKCTRKRHATFYEWSNRTCAQITGGHAQARRAARNMKFRGYAKSLTPGQWFLSAARADDTHELFLGRTVASDDTDWHGDCKYQHKGKDRVTDSGVRFDPGDYAIAVQWYGRLMADNSNLTFKMDIPQIDIINSTELRLSGFDMELLQGTPENTRICKRRGAQRTADEVAKAVDRVWKLSAANEATALACCNG
jgi:hypothetical protein